MKKIVRVKRTDRFSIEGLKNLIKKYRGNMHRQRRKREAGVLVRVRPEFWEQAIYDVKRIIEKFNAQEDETICKCGGKEFYYAPIVHVRCASCHQPLPNLKKNNDKVPN